MLKRKSPQKSAGKPGTSSMAEALIGFAIQRAIWEAHRDLYRKMCRRRARMID